jgi:hypothetical protein
VTFAPPPSRTIDPPAERAIPLDDDDEAKRRALLAKLRDDRKDLVRVAGVVRDLAETLEVAQNSLAMLRGSLRWLALAGGVAALTMSMRARRRTSVFLLTGVSLFLVQRWLSHPVRHGLATSSHPVVVGHSAATMPSPLSSSGRNAVTPPSARPGAA